MRSCVVVCVRQTTGRSSEVAWMTLDYLEWDPLFKCTFSMLPQSKVSETKLTCFVAGASRHECFYVALGDMLTLDVDPHLYEDDAASWMFRSLQKIKQPGTASK
jgi:hypothetical protein